MVVAAKATLHDLHPYTTKQKMNLTDANSDLRWEIVESNQYIVVMAYFVSFNLSHVMTFSRKVTKDYSLH